LSKEKKPHGRPSKYKPEYDEMLIQHLADGYTFESFLSKLPDVSSDDTLYEWLKVHPTFSDAKKKGVALGRYFWEQVGKEGITGKNTRVNFTGWIFMMKNRYKWHDNVQIQNIADPTDKSKDTQIQKLTEQLTAIKSMSDVE